MEHQNHENKRKRKLSIENIVSETKCFQDERFTNIKSECSSDIKASNHDVYNFFEGTPSQPASVTQENTPTFKETPSQPATETKENASTFGELTSPPALVTQENASIFEETPSQPTPVTQKNTFTFGETLSQSASVTEENASTFMDTPSHPASVTQENTPTFKETPSQPATETKENASTFRELTSQPASVTQENASIFKATPSQPTSVTQKNTFTFGETPSQPASVTEENASTFMDTPSHPASVTQENTPTFKETPSQPATETKENASTFGESTSQPALVTQANSSTHIRRAAALIDVGDRVSVARGPMLTETPIRNSQFNNRNSPKQPSEQVSVKRKTFAGDEYQKVMQVLIRQRGLKHPGSSVGCEVRGVGSFDDIVFIRGEVETNAECRFFQIKHVNRITTHELFETDIGEDEIPKGSLNLLRCFEDFCKMKNNPHFKDGTFGDVTFITKRDIEFESEEEKGFFKEEKWNQGVDCWNEQDKKAEKYSLITNKIIQQKQRFVELLHEYSKKHKHPDTLVHDFLESFRIIVRYSNKQYYTNETISCKRKNADLRYFQGPGNAFRICKYVAAPFKNISSTELLKTKVQLGKPGQEFNLFSYFESFLKIKDNRKFKNNNLTELTIVTTKGVEEKVTTSMLIEEDLKYDECLYFEKINAKKYKLNLDSGLVTKSIQAFIKDHKFQSKEEEIREFLSKIRLVVDYSQLGELKNLTFGEVFGDELNEDASKVILQGYIMHQEAEELSKRIEFIKCEEWRSRISEWIKPAHSLDKLITKRNIDTLREQVSVEYSFENKELLKSIENFKAQNDKYIFNLKVKNVTFCSIVVLHTLTNDNRENHRCFNLEQLNPSLINSLETNCDGSNIVIYDMEKSLNNSEMKDARETAKALINCNNKIILITSKHFNFAEDCLIDKVITEEYSFGFKDLNDDFKHKVLSTPIHFQGEPVRLETLIRDPIFASNVIDEQFLWEIVGGQNEGIFMGQSVNIDSDLYDEDYFVARSAFKKAVAISSISGLLKTHLSITLYDKSTKNENVVDNLKKDGIGENEIREWKFKQNGKLIEKKRNQLSWNENITLANGLVLISIDDYKKVESNQKLKVHSQPRFLFMFKGLDLYFVDAFHIANSSDLIALTDTESFKCIKIDELFLTNNEICILAADSGSGKSTSLMAYAKMLKQIDSSMWVVRVELRKFYNEKMKKKSDGWSEVSEVKNSIKVVSTMSLGDDFEDNFYYRILEQGMKKDQNPNFKLVLLLDGYNEINVAFQDITRNLIKTLVKECNYHQIWITTQLDKKNELEIDFNTPATFLCNLSFEKQVELMIRYWEKQYKKRQEENPVQKETYTDNELRQDAESALHKLSKSIKDSSFSVVCLNVIMLADYLILRDRKIEDSIELPFLYDKFFLKKLTICAKTSRSSGENVDVAKDKCFLIIMRDVHEEVAAKYYFKLHWKTEDFKKMSKMNKLDRFVQTQFNGVSQKSMEHSKGVISKIGVLTWKGDELDFYHESFAQFFFSGFLLKNIDNVVVQDVLVNVVLINKDLKLCRTFLENSLKNFSPLENNSDCDFRLFDPFEIKLKKKISKNLKLQTKLGKRFIEEKLLYTLILFLSIQTVADVKSFVTNIKEEYNMISVDMNNKDLFKKSYKIKHTNGYRWRQLAEQIISAAGTDRSSVCLNGTPSSTEDSSQLPNIDD